MISLIIPALNEEKAIEALLVNITALSGAKDVVVADGGSTDRTKELSTPFATVVDCPRGRGPQCNFGASRAVGDIFFFLHADSLLEHDALHKIELAVAQGVKWGCLKLRFDDAHWFPRLIAWASNKRVRLCGIAFGDQGIFITRGLFEQLGGFPDLPLMEDYQLSLILRERKIAPIQVNSYIVSSARRFIDGGFLRVIMQMRRLRKLYRRGADICDIKAMYRDIRYAE